MSKKEQRFYPDNKPRLCYKIIQSSRFLSSIQIKVYAAIASYTGPVSRHQVDIAKDIGVSVRAFQNAINCLIRLGIILREYGTFKRVTYFVVPIETQKQILENPLKFIYKTAIKYKEKVARKIKKTPMISSDMHEDADLKTHADTEPTKEIFKKEINNTSLTTFNLKPEKKKSFNDRKNELLEQIEYIKLNGLPNMNF